MTQKPSSKDFNVGDYVVVVSDLDYPSNLKQGDTGHIKKFYGAMGGAAAFITIDDGSEHPILLKDVALYEEVAQDIIESDVSLDDLFGGVIV